MRRLPEGVEYTHIKTIFIDLPSGLTALLWSTPSPGDTLVAAFKGKTIRAIDRALRREEQHQSGSQAAAIRHELVNLCLSEANAASSPHPERRISVTFVAPQRFDPQHRPPGPSVQHVRIMVSSAELPRKRGRRVTMAPSVLEERIIVSEPAGWDPSVPFINPDAVDLSVLDLLRKHFPRLMGIRVSARWRSKYSPEGWKLVTQHVVPQLYEYLRPFYPVRRYRRPGRSGPSQYPVRLRRDITDIIRFELPYARKLTVERVTAAIQRYTARQQSIQERATTKRPKK
jgi:hypothetical protein